MNCITTQKSNPIERFVSCFPSVTAAAEGAGVSREMLRQIRHRGYVSTRERALVMSKACNGKVKPAELLALEDGKGRAAQ